MGLSAAPVPAKAGSWEGFRLRDEAHIEDVIATVRLLKAAPEAQGKPVYVNVFSPFTVAMQCDPRLLERLSSEVERPAIAEGLRAIAEASAEYISRLAAAGADGIFYSNKCLRSALGLLVEQWVLPLDRVALAPLRNDASLTTEESSDELETQARHLDMV